MASYDPIHRTASPYDQQHGNYDNYGTNQQGGYSDQGGYGNYGHQQGYPDQPQGYADQPNTASSLSVPRNGAGTPYGSGDGYYNESSGFIASQTPQKKKLSPWIKFGVPIGILIIAGVVVGVVLGIKHHNDTAAASSSSNSAAAASSAAAALGLFATATDSLYMMPVYPSTTNSAAFTTPTVFTNQDSNLAWPTDTFSPSNPQPTSVRPDRPRLIAPQYKWDALNNLIQNDDYMQSWNATIFTNATFYYSQPPVVYFMDGDSGILDNSRDVKRRVKVWAYAYRMTNDTKWVDRTWEELQNAAGNGTTTFGPSVDRWNSPHFLDVAEMSAAFAIAYDWMYDAWTSSQKAMIISTTIEYGMSFGQTALVGPDPTFIGWWANDIQGNWNCVCNNGMTMAALAFIGDDTSGLSEALLGKTVANATANCAFAVTTDGTWTETSDYWYFGITGMAEMAASLVSATGSDYGLTTVNPNLTKTGLFHMYVQGPTEKFAYGDTGPNKYSSTANAMLYFADVFDIPRYALYQRDHYDVAEPWSMFWYDASTAGAWWDGLPLDAVFDDPLDQWASMRSSWTDSDALFVGVKAGANQGRQTHNDLDVGDFMIEALGSTWVGELGDGDYRAPFYFSNDTQTSERWWYYRKMTEGQNVILVNSSNQNVAAAPTISFGTTNETQGSSTVYTASNGSTAYFTADIASAYFSDVSAYKRGVRMINARRQVLVQDEITSTSPIQFRLHTNATVNVDSSGTSATFKIGSNTMTMQILNPPSGVKINTGPDQRLSTDVTPPEADQPNNTTLVTIDNMPAGTYQLEVLFNPQWPGMDSSDYVTPSSVSLDNWSLTSHP